MKGENKKPVKNPRRIFYRCDNQKIRDRSCAGMDPLHPIGKENQATSPMASRPDIVVVAETWSMCKGKKEKNAHARGA